MNNGLIAMALGLMLSATSASFAEESKDAGGNIHEAMPATDEKKSNADVDSGHEKMKDQATHHDETKKKKRKGGHRKGHHKKHKHDHKTGEHHGEQGHNQPQVNAMEGDAKKAEHAAEPMQQEASAEKKN